MSARRSATAATPTPAAPALATPTRSVSSSTSSGSTLRRSRRFTASRMTETDARHNDLPADKDGSDSESGSSPDRTPTVPMIRRRNAMPPMPHSSSRRSVTMPAAPHTPSPSNNDFSAAPALARATPCFTTPSTVAATPVPAASVPSATPAPAARLETPAPVPSATSSATPRTASTKRKLFHSSRLSRSNSMASLATPSPDSAAAARASSPLAPHLLPLDLASLNRTDPDPEDYRAMLNALMARACRRPLSKSRFLRACAVLRPILDRDAALQVARVDVDDLPVSVTATPLAGNSQTGMDVDNGAGSSGSDTDPDAEDRRLVAQLTAITAFPKRHTAPPPPPNRPGTPRSDSLWPSARGVPPPPPDAAAAAAGATPTQPFDPLANLSHLELAAPDRNLLMRRWQRHRRPATMAAKAETAGQKKPAIIEVSDSDDDDDNQRAPPRRPPPPKATPPTPDALDRILLEVSATSHATSAASVGMANKHLVGAGGRAVKKRKLRATKPVGYAEAGHA
ncbi:hypothetical protein GGF32_001528 [Allomyces javanicus]|nr:hypothetical protein GGF32_001528 [Allomyces javanicus]